jgi:hypothetical protein
MYKVMQKLQFYTFFYPLNVLIPSSCSQQCNRLTIFWLAEKRPKNANKTLKNQITIFTRPKSLSLKPRKL